MPSLKSRVRAFFRSAAEEAVGGVAAEVAALRQEARQLHRSSEAEVAAVNGGRMLAALNETRTLPHLRDYGFKVFSQFGEDGVIQRLISGVPTPDESFVEIGVEDYAESNTRFLLQKDNWRGLLIDSGDEAAEYIRARALTLMRTVDFRQAFVTAENVDDLLRDRPEDLGLLSIDVDGMDYWIWKAVTVVRPRIVAIEYQSNFGPSAAIAVPYDPAFDRRSYHPSELCFGASLAALDELGRAKGYALVGTSEGPNAFFVRDDCLGAVPRVTAADCYYETRYRESRDLQGEPTFLSSMADRRREIAGCLVEDVRTGERRPLREFDL